MRPVCSCSSGSRLPAPGSRSAVLDDLELRIGDLQPARAPDLDLAEQHDALLRLDDVLEERLIRPHRLDLAAVVLHQRREQPEARAGASCARPALSTSPEIAAVMPGPAAR